MTRILLPLLLLLSLLSLLFTTLSGEVDAGMVDAQGGTGGDHQNAATWYRRAINGISLLSPEDWEAIDTFLIDPTQDPPPRLREILTRFRPSMNNLQRGARQPHSDFQLPYEDGFKMKYLHLLPLKKIGYLLRTDAFVQLHDGHPAAATEAIGSLYRLGGHLGEDRILVSSLVADMSFKLGDMVFQNMLDQGAIDPTLARSLLQTTSQLNPQDPFNFVEALAMEQELARTTLQKIMNKDDRADKLTELFNVDGESNQVIARLSPDAFSQELSQYDAMMTQMVEIFKGGDPVRGRKKLEQLNLAMESGEHGLLAKFLVPTTTIGRAFDRMHKSRDLLAARLDLLRGIATGEINPLQKANAALWYLRAAELLETRPAADLEMLRAYDFDIAPTLNEELTEFLDEATDIFDILHEAMAMRKCDFSFTRPDSLLNYFPNAPVLAPPYAIGLRDLERLITLDALHHLRSGNQEQLADRLTLGFTLTVHLSTDPMFTSALTAHQGLNHLEALAASALEVKLLSPAAKSALHTILHRMPRRDPCGYIAALVEARRQMTDFYIWVVPEGVDPKELHKQAESIINNFRGNQLLNLAAILDTMRQTEAGDADHQPPFSLTALHDIYDLTALEQARERTPRIAPLLTAGVPEKLPPVLKNQSIPQIAPLHRKTLDARRDLRKTLNLFKLQK